MQRYFIYLSFDGAAYHGWQIQPNGVSVQEKLEQALATLLRRPTPVTGAGRTDAGVHARMMVAHFDDPEPLDAPQLAYRLNRLLPQDIGVSRVVPVAQDMHARFSARSRQYQYRLHLYKDPFLRHYSTEIHYKLDFVLMNAGAERLIGTRDFACFCKAGADSKTTICQLTHARWVEEAPGQWVFTIEANRFLRNMVRAVVGTLIEVGRHRMTLQDLDRVLEGGRRSDAGESVPAKGLALTNIIY